MKVIHYDPAELWDLFVRDKDALLSKTKVIAENPDFDVMIFLTAEEHGNTVLPNVVVWEEMNEVCDECAVNEDDLRKTASDIYSKYLPDEALLKQHFGEDIDDTDEDEQELQEAEIESREEELYDAAEDFLFTVTGGQLEKIVGFAEASDIIDDFVNRTCEYLFMEHGISVFRPMMVEDEKSEAFYDEYPYDLLTFDD